MAMCTQVPAEMPPSVPAVIYDEADLAQYVWNGGSLVSLFSEKIKAGTRIVYQLFPLNGPPVVIAVLATLDDVKRADDAARKFRERLNDLFNSGKSASK